MSEKDPAIRQNKSYLKAPAKLNIGLSLVGRNQDFHLIESLFWPINFCDDLVLTPTKEDAIETEWDSTAPFPSTALPPEYSNLAFRALKSLRETRTGGIKIQLKKRIPIGAGLGGGSSDAAAVLRHLSAGNSSDKMTMTARTLGADVPFFLNPHPAWVTGIGENCRYLKVAPCLHKKLTFFMVFPPHAIQTGEIFAEYKRRQLPFSPTQDPFACGEVTLDNLASYTPKNDLEPIVCSQVPLIQKLLDQLRTLPCLYAGLSGTGSTCFSIHLDTPKKHLKDAADFFRSVGCRSVIGKSFEKE